jgi:hypothetical protein
MGEFEKAKNTFRQEMEEAMEPARSMNSITPITSPVASEREKLETIANSLGIEDCAGLTDEQLRALISKRMTR